MEASIPSISEGFTCIAPLLLYLSTLFCPCPLNALFCFWEAELLEQILGSTLYLLCMQPFPQGRVNMNGTSTTFLCLPNWGGKSSALPSTQVSLLSLFLQAQLQFSAFPLSLPKDQIHEVGWEGRRLAGWRWSGFFLLPHPSYPMHFMSSTSLLPTDPQDFPCENLPLPWAFPPHQYHVTLQIMQIMLCCLFFFSFSLK